MMRHQMRKLQGLTLVELMISITLALILMGATAVVYLSDKISYQTTAEMTRLQESGRFAVYYLTKNLKFGKYFGCANKSTATITNRITANSTIYGNTNSLSGYDGGSSSFSPTLPSTITGTPVYNSDIIAVLSTTYLGLHPTVNMSATTSAITVSGANIAVGQPLFISNCTNGDQFRASSGTSSTSITHLTDYNTSTSLSTTYDTSSEILKLNYFAYYVRNTGRVNSVNEPIYALVSEDAFNNITEIATGIEQMQISYAVDTDASEGANSYQTATQVQAGNNWGNVVGVQISLLCSTIENVAKNPQPYYFNGATITPTDRKLRKQWDVFVSFLPVGAIL